LTYSALPKLNPNNLLVALRWFEQQPPQELGPIAKLQGGILSLALEYIEADGVADLLAKTVFERAKSFRQIPRNGRSKDFSETLANDVVRRRRFLKAFLPLLNRDNAYLVLYPLSLLLPEDLDWLIDRRSRFHESRGDHEGSFRFLSAMALA
jgi:hypothetical protein